MTPRCPRCDAPLYGGPVQWHCDVHGAVWAADLPREVHHPGSAR